MEKEEIFYHYCSPEGFKNIIEEGCLWLCPTMASNDYDEISHALNYAYMYFDNNNFKVGKEIILKNNLFAEGNISQFKYLHTCSLSEEKDSLNQWITYGKNGEGFAIGFKRSILPSKEYSFLGSFEPANSNIKEINDFAFFSKVIYKDEDKIKLLEKVFSTDVTEVSFCKDFLRLAPLFKNSGFQGEKEHRIIYDPIKLSNNESEENLRSIENFRISKYGMTTYYKYKFKNKQSGIKVVVGPKNHTMDSTIRRFMITNGYLDFGIEDIFRSEISYR